MKHDITIAGKTFRNLALNRAMLEVARNAVANGIHPTALQLHNGTANAKNRWTRLGGRVDAHTVRRAVKDPRRWFLNSTELLFTEGETWALTNQWSWDEPYGSSREDLEYIQRAFPQLELWWRRY